MTMRKNFQKLSQALRRSRSIVITTHVNPDADAITAELAMAQVLKAWGKKVAVVNHGSFPGRLCFIPGTAIVKKFLPLKKWGHDALLILDCGALGRIGDVAALAGPEVTVINLDHHLTNDLFGHVNVVRATASSTTEVIYDWFKWERIPLDQKLARWVYLGMMTDTGSFRYENTSAHTHEVAADLMRFDLPVAKLYREAYEAIPKTDVCRFFQVICQAQYYFDGRVAEVRLTQKTVRQFSGKFDLRDNIFRELRTIRGIEAICILTEEGPRKTKVNFRSTGKIDVARIAATFGGGGHRCASGCSLGQPLPTAGVTVRRIVKKNLN